mgnify:CR=1 FL=1
MAKKILGYIRVVRPRAWTKNFFIFGAILFANKFLILNLLWTNIAGFFIFCFLSGAVYIINDIADAELDKLDPNKCRRPIASGVISKGGASVFAFILLSVSLTSAYFINPYFLVISGVYFVINILYSSILKHVVLIDIIIIASGFVLRALAGAIIISSEPSYWFLVTTFFLALLLASSKRRFEYIFFLEHDKDKKKAVLSDYSEKLLDQLISISATGALISYSLYTISNPRGIEHRLVYTIPLVLYGIFRYLYIVYKKGQGGDPDKILINDPHILGTVSVYGITVALLYFYS